MTDLKIVLTGLIVSVALLQGCASNPPARDRFRDRPSADQKSLFESGMSAYDRGDFEASERLFEEMISGYPGSPLLMESQWMLGRSYENQGNWQRASVQYRSYTVNFPKGPRAEEARVRMEIIEGVRRQALGKPETPFLYGVEVQEGDAERAAGSYRAAGVNTVLIDGGADGGKIARDDISEYQKNGFRVIAIIRFSAPDLFEDAARIRLQEQLVEFGALNMDGVLFDADSVSAPDWYRPEILNLVSESFGTAVDENVLHENPALFWRWAGWKGRNVIQILREAVEPVRRVRSPFYWGIVVPAEAITVPNQFLAESGLDLLEAKNGGADYFGIKAGKDENGVMVLAKAAELIGDSQRVASVLQRPADTGTLIPPIETEWSILYLSDASPSQDGLTKNLP